MIKNTLVLLFITFFLSAYSEDIIKTKIAYSKNGEIHFDYIGEENAKALTTGFSDMKPSITINGDKIVFFRVIQFNQSVAFWKTAICIINTDGTGFKQVTSGRYTDYNPTWTRDGNDKIIFSRYNGNVNKSSIYMSSIESGPGEEILISDPFNSEYAYSCLKDGRILISSSRNILKGVFYLLTPPVSGKRKYDLINFDFNIQGFMDRTSFSQDQTKITYEYKESWNSFEYTGKNIIIADFDLSTITISNPQVISSETKSDIITIYPRWTKDGNNIIYHSNRSGKKQLYLYSLIDNTTNKISLDENADYEFPCGDGAPK